MMAALIDSDEKLLEVSNNITSVSEYLEVLKYIDSIRMSNEYLSTSLFFRGFTNSTWVDEPSIYRKDPSTGKSNVDYEDKLYFEIISKCPDNFRNCQSALDHLVLMQHYGLPTRLLDVTENPLVALYFACANSDTIHQSDGKVAIYETDDIKNYNSDTVAMLANLAVEDVGFTSLGIKMRLIMNQLRSNNYPNKKDIIRRIIRIYENLIRENNTEAAALIESIYFSEHGRIESTSLKDWEDLKILIEKHNCIDFYRTSGTVDQISFWYFNPNRILYSIKSEKSYFELEKMNATTFENVVFVKSKQDNPNIIKQNGAFMLFGVKANSLNKRDYAKVPPVFYFGIGDRKEQKIACIIKDKYKKDILEELRSLSISESYLFPDISHVAKELKIKYLN